MATLRQIRNNWHLLIDEQVLRLAEGPEVQILWGCSYYDGPANGVARYNDQYCWFERISGGSHAVEYEGLEIHSTFYAVVLLTDEEYAALKERNTLFTKLVGDYINYTYTIHEEDDEDDNGNRIKTKRYQRVRGKHSEVDTKAGFKEYCERTKDREPFDKHYDKPVIGWWIC